MPVVAQVFGPDIGQLIFSLDVYVYMYSHTYSESIDGSTG